MLPFDFNLPTKIIFGAGKFKSVHKYVRGFGKKAFIITSSSFAGGGSRAHLLDGLIKSLEKNSVETRVFSEIEPNPRTHTIDKASKIAREYRPRYIIALGGGSVMDAAKCVSMLAENDGEIYEYAYRGVGKSMRHFNSALPLVCIPTIAASGSEANFYAVVTNQLEHRKVTVFGEALYPRLSIIDPELTCSLSKEQTVDSAFDIITHVTETYLSSNVQSPLQDELTLAIVKTVVRALPVLLNDSNNIEARSQLSWCSSLALSGFLSGRTGGWPIHALEHGISAWNDMSHGRGLAILLPRIMEFDSGSIPDKIIKFNKDIFGVNGVDDPTKSLQMGLIRFMKEVGAWTLLNDLDESLIQKIIDHTFEISAVYKQDEKPYLENIKNIYCEDVFEILWNCKINSI